MIISPAHRPLQHLNRRLDRPLNRYSARVQARARRSRIPNYIVISLGAFRQAIRAHRRLMKLAPERFDKGMVRHLEQQREKEKRRWDEIFPVFLKVYGDSARTLRPFHERIPERKRSPRTEHVIARELEVWGTALELGNEALALFRKHHQWSRLTVAQLCSLLDVASILGRLSTGMETHFTPPPEERPSGLSFDESLKKIYGEPPEESAECTTPPSAEGATMVQ